METLNRNEKKRKEYNFLKINLLILPFFDCRTISSFLTFDAYINQIVLQDGEYITRISGKYGYDRGRNQQEIVTLKVHTNLCMEGYGPYGQGLDVETAYEFSSPILINKHIIGFFGRHNNVLESIGVLLQKVRFYFIFCILYTTKSIGVLFQINSSCISLFLETFFHFISLKIK